MILPRSTSPITLSADFPQGAPGASYVIQISASGGASSGSGQSPCVFSTFNSSLPGSLSLNPETGLINGQLPSSAGTYPFTLMAVDISGEAGIANCSIVVSTSVMSLGLASVRCDVIAGQQFTQTLSGTGGTGGPYSIALDWERVPSDPLDATLKNLSLPEGVTYDGTTGLGGTPMQTGSYSIPVIVANGTGSAPATFILQVNSGGGAPPWAITTPAVLPDLLAGQPQTYFKQIEVADGAAYTLQFAVSGSSGLPAGLNLSSSGLLSGTPGVGVHTFQISVTDNLGRTESRAFTLHCTETPFAFTTPAPGISINGPVDKLMKFQFSTTTPFTAPRTFSMAPGSTLPEGCAISASGYFTYTSPVPKSFEFDLEVADATGRRSSGHFMVHIHAVGETPSGQTPPPGGGPDTEPKEPVEPFSFTYYHAAGAASSGGERKMVQDPFQYSQMPIYGEDPDGPGPVDPPEIGYYWRTGWIEATETGATGWANDATRSVTFSGETFAENQNSLLNFMDGIMTGPGSSQPGQGASSSWTVGETVGNPILITGGECYFVPDETHVSTSPPASNATVSIGGAETCNLECIGLRGEVKSQAAPGASETFIFSWTEALTTDVGPRVIHYGTATFTNDTSGACWTMAGNGPITNAAPDPHDLLLKPQVIKGKTFSVGPLLPVEIDQQNYNAADGIRFSRWLDAFPSNSFDNQAADKDRDRFRIKIAGNIPNLTKAKIKATDLHGAVIDGQFVNKTTDGDYEIEMKAEGGSMVSTPIMLVTDGDDDKKYNGKGTDDGNDDQTLLADFDSKVVVTFPELNNAQVEFKASKPKGEIKLNVFYLSLDGTLPQDKRDTINLHLRKAREIYRQVATKVTVTNISPFTLPAEFVGYLAERKNANGDVVEAANYLSPIECDKLIFEMRQQTQHPVPAGQMLVTYIDARLEPSFGKEAHGFVSNDANPNNPPVVVSLYNDGTTKSDIVHPVTAHEVGHVLGVDHPGVITHLLMTDGNIFTGMTYNKTQRDSKRIREEDYNKMKGREAFYVPLQ